MRRNGAGLIRLADARTDRRVHQASTRFRQERHRLTPVQYAALVVIRSHRNRRHATVRGDLLDRSTIGDVLDRLRQGWVIRRATAHDRRIKRSRCRGGGDPRQVEPAIRRVQERLLAPLTAASRTPCGCSPQIADAPEPTTRCARVIDVQEFIDTHPLSRVQRRLVVLCFLVVAIDGFDTAIIGLPRAGHSRRVGTRGAATRAALRRRAVRLDGRRLRGWTGRRSVRPKDHAGRVDPLLRRGRLASSFSPDLPSLTWLRFLTGVGLGGAMPTAITLTSEYCPTTSAVVARHGDVLRLHDWLRAGRAGRGAGGRRRTAGGRCSSPACCPSCWPRCCGPAARVRALSGRTRS